MNGRDPRPAHMQGQRSTIAPKECGRIADDFFCTAPAGHEPPDAHISEMPDIDANGQMVVVTRAVGDNHLRQRFSMRSNARGEVVLQVDTGVGTAVNLDERAAGAITRFLARKFHTLGVAHAKAELASMLEERRMSALPNETLVTAANEARALYSTIATRIIALSAERDGAKGEALRLALDLTITELTSIAAPLKSAVSALARPAPKP